MPGSALGAMHGRRDACSVRRKQLLLHVCECRGPCAAHPMLKHHACCAWLRAEECYAAIVRHQQLVIPMPAHVLNDGNTRLRMRKHAPARAWQGVMLTAALEQHIHAGLCMQVAAHLLAS